MAAMNISEKRFQELMNEGKAVLVDYWAPWCGYCRRIGPAYDRIADQFSGELEVVKVNIDEAMDLARREQIEVIPTLVLYRDGKALASVVAPESKAAIEEFIRGNLK
jgi:thioredoxin 1